MGIECYFSEDSEERRARKIVSICLETLQIIMTTEIRILKAILVRLQMELNKTYLETSILDIKCQGT